MFKSFFNKYLLSSILLSTITMLSYCASEADENPCVREIKTAIRQGSYARIKELALRAVQAEDREAVKWGIAQLGSDVKRIRGILGATIALNKGQLTKLILNRVPREIKESVINGPLPNLTEKRTPLHLAAELGHDDVMKELLRHRANLHALDAIGQTPLHYAVIHYQYTTMQILLAHRANPNAQDRDGNTPLHYAADKSIIAWELLDHGANKHLENNKHQTYTSLENAHRLMRNLPNKTIQSLIDRQRI